MKQYTGTRDCIQDAIDMIQSEMPGAYIVLCVGVPNTTTTLGFTNLESYWKDPEAWDMIYDTIGGFLE